MFTLSPSDMRAACFKDLTQVREVLINGVPTITAQCPICRRALVSHRIASSWQDNASVMLEAYQHVERCKASRGPGPHRPCSGPHGWCGKAASLVCTDGTGLQWYACEERDHQHGAKTEAIAQWFSRHGLAQ